MKYGREREKETEEDMINKIPRLLGLNQGASCAVFALCVTRSP